MRLREIGDVAGGVIDFLDLQRVDHQAELFHVGARSRAYAGGELFAVTDHVFDVQAADDGAQVTGEDIAHPLIHLVLLVEEPARGIRDRREIVTDFEDDDAFQTQRDSLGGDALDLQLVLAQIQGKPAYGLDTRNDQGPFAGDDPETEALADAVRRIGVEARDDQSLVGLGHPPGKLEQQDDDDHRADDNYRDHGNSGHALCSCPRDDPAVLSAGSSRSTGHNRLTYTVRGAWNSATITLVPVRMVSLSSAG